MGEITFFNNLIFLSAFDLAQFATGLSFLSTYPVKGNIHFASVKSFNSHKCGSRDHFFILFLQIDLK